MKVYVTNNEGEEKFFSSLRKAKKVGGDIQTIDLDIDSLSHEGCTREDIEEWTDTIDLWLVE